MEYVTPGEIEIVIKLDLLYTEEFRTRRRTPTPNTHKLNIVLDNKQIPSNFLELSCISSAYAEYYYGDLYDCAQCCHAPLAQARDWRGALCSFPTPISVFKVHKLED
eukprot:IDg719t1